MLESSETARSAAPLPRSRRAPSRGRSPRACGRPSGSRGQASAELVAVVPLALVVILAAAQAVVAGYALWSATLAARAGARAEHVGGDASTAARSALPSPLRRGARIESAGTVEVTVAAPVLVPGVAPLEVRAASALDPAAGDG